MAFNIDLEFADNQPISDADLILRISNGDEAALALLYDRYQAFLFGLLFRILQNHSEAENILQEVFVQVWQQAEKFDEKQGKVFTWLVMITRSKAIDRIRYVRTRKRAIEKLEIKKQFCSNLEFEQHPILQRRRKHVLLALSQLPENQLSILLMAYFEGYRQSEIAERTNIPLGTVKTRMRMGLTKLRESLNTDSDCFLI